MTAIPAAIRREIVARVAAGGSYSQVARDVGHSYAAVREICIRAGVLSVVRSTSKSPWNEQFVEQWKGTR